MSLSYKLSGSVFRPLFFCNRNFLSSLSGEHLTTGQNVIHPTITGCRVAGEKRFQQQQAGIINVDKNLQISHPNIEKFNSNIVLSSSQDSDPGNQQQESESDGKGSEGLKAVHDSLSKQLPYFFTRPHDFRIYRKDIIFEDNVRNVHTKGLNAYAWRISLIKLGAHLKYGKISLNVLKITSHPEDNTVRVRWRIVTVPGNQIVFAFWKIRLWNLKESMEKYSDEWIDGFSIFYCDSDGKVFKHVADKVIPDSDPAQNKDIKPGLAMKLA